MPVMKYIKKTIPLITAAIMLTAFVHTAFGQEEITAQTGEQTNVSSQNSAQKLMQNSDPIASPQISELVIAGNKRISTQEILENINFTPDTQYSEEAVQKILKSIYDTGYFSDRLQAIPIKIDDKNIKLKIIVEENLPVKYFAISGNGVMQTNDILKTLKPLEGKPLNVKKINLALQKIQERYIQDGFAFAKIVSVEDRIDGSLKITVDEGIIGSVIVKGSNILTRPGKVYNANDLQTDIKNLCKNEKIKSISPAFQPDTTHPGTYRIILTVKSK